MNLQGHGHSRSRSVARAAVLCAAVWVAMVAFAAAPASAATAPTLACGTTQPGPCTETAHFSNQAGLQTPVGAATNATNCPNWILSDFVLLDFTGNGVEHNTVNKAQDFWSTSTFTGTGTVTFYPQTSLANLVFDDQGNIVSYDIVGPPDATATGHLTDWFGISANNKSLVFHNTINFTGTSQSNAAIALHVTGHAGWTPGSTPFVDPPHTSFTKATC